MEMCHYYYVLSVFSENMGHPQLQKIVIIKKCPKLPWIYGTIFAFQGTQTWLAGIYKMHYSETLLIELCTFS